MNINNLFINYFLFSVFFEPLVVVDLSRRVLPKGRKNLAGRKSPVQPNLSLELCSLATEGTLFSRISNLAEIKSGICNSHRLETFVFDAMFCRLVTMGVANSRLLMLPNSEILQNEGEGKASGFVRVLFFNKQVVIFIF